MMPTIKPVPAELSGVAYKVAAWAAQKKLINRVYVFGGMFKGKPNPKDLDLAVEYILTEENEIYGVFISDCQPWTRELSKITGFVVDFDLAHPSSDDVVWPALNEGCGIMYERSDPVDLPWLNE